MSDAMHISHEPEYLKCSQF